MSLSWDISERPTCPAPDLEPPPGAWDLTGPPAARHPTYPAWTTLNLGAGATGYAMLPVIATPYAIRSIWMLAPAPTDAANYRGCDVALRLTNDDTADATTWGAATRILWIGDQATDLLVAQPLLIPGLWWTFPQARWRLIWRAVNQVAAALRLTVGITWSPLTTHCQE